MKARGWDDFGSWHELFDALCNQRGWYDNADPASALCALLGKNKVQDFESAKKKLRGWRAGQRLPLRRNFILLGQMLRTDESPDLHRCWMELYRRAQVGPANIDAPVESAPPPKRRPRRAGLAVASIAALSGCAIIYAAAAVFPNDASSALPSVNFEGRVRVPVGFSVLIHGALDGCDEPPPDWQRVTAAISGQRLGQLDDGGLARKIVRKCGRERVVRAVRYTGLRTGTEELRLFGDYIRIDVVDARQERQLQESLP